MIQIINIIRKIAGRVSKDHHDGIFRHYLAQSCTPPWHEKMPAGNLWEDHYPQVRMKTVALMSK